MTNRYGEPPGVQPADGRDLHCGDRRVTHGGWQQPDSHAKALGHGERGRGQRQSAGQKAVLHDPELVVAEHLGASGERG